MENREEMIAEVDGKIEEELELIGATAIEDKLQDKVADTIQFIKATGIKVWVLTGDKVETAQNIGLSAGLLDHKMEQHIIQCQDKEEIKVELIRKGTLIQSVKQNNPYKKQALLVAGASLSIITADESLKEKFLDNATDCDVVLACRVSPAQKAEIVSLVRERFPDKTTLSIGDGANDVPMIMKAHVGVGILGKEG